MDERLRSATQYSNNPIIHPSNFVALYSFVVKNKNPTAIWQWGSQILQTQSEPDRRAAQQQRVSKQQVQIHIHDSNLAIIPPNVNPFFGSV